jgi:eukaryotic-like serine/threonine-protein kinase
MGGAPQFVGRTISNYRVLEKLGSGGMGTVYRAEDLRLGREVALKLLRDDWILDQGSIERFRREARSASSLNHPNICTVYEAGEDDGVPYLVMELLHGQTLAEMIATRPLKVVPMLQFAIQVCDALECAHEKGIIHRDLKPSNIFVNSRGDVKLLDFGLAKRLHPENSEATLALTTAMTRQGQLLGTVAYMSPEQAEGKDVDARSDLFSVGAVLYEMATGRRAFPGESAATVVAAVLRGEPRPLEVLNPESPPELARIIGKTLEKDPADRYQSAKELAVDCRRLLRQLTVPSAGSMKPGRIAWRRFWARYVGYAISALVAAIVVAMLLAPTSAPAPLASRQITFSTEPKEPPLITDGSRLYFESHGAPSQMSVNGGIIAPMGILEPGTHLLDISADGSKVLALTLDKNDDINRGWLSVGSTLGGAPRRLSDHLAQAGKWSPDGHALVFADQKALYRSDEDGSNIKKIWDAPGSVSGMSFSPDGKELCVSAGSFPSRLWQIGSDGSKAHPLQLEWPANANQEAGQWTPDGRHFIFMSDVEGRSNVYEVVRPRWFEFWKKPRAAMLTGNQIDIEASVPSRDAKTLFDLGRLDQGAMQVFDPKTESMAPFLDGVSALSFVISPDRQWMVYSEYPTGYLWKSRLDGSERLQLTSAPGYYQQWSPDGKWVVYSDWHKLYMVPANGGAPEKLIQTGEFEVAPSWSPDGKSIMFSYYDFTDEPIGVYVLDLASRKVSAMAGAERYYVASWSPDGKYIVAMARDPSRMMLYNAATKEWKELKRLDVPWGYWIWSSDSKSIYMAVISGQDSIFKLTVPDGAWQKIVGLKSVSSRGSDGFISLSADGQPVIMSHTGVAQIYALRWNQ